jgi:hypothetical protein
MFAYKKREEKNVKCCVREPWKEDDISAALSLLFYNSVADREECEKVARFIRNSISQYL